MRSADKGRTGKRRFQENKSVRCSCDNNLADVVDKMLQGEMLARTWRILENRILVTNGWDWGFKSRCDSTGQGRVQLNSPSGRSAGAHKWQ